MLALIGIWIAYEIGREIVVNLIYENRSKDKALTLVDHYLYNLEDDGPTLPVQLNHLHGDDIFEFYDDAVIDVDNVSKFRGVGVSMKFQKADGSALVICIRNDIYYSPNYTIQAFAPGGSPTAQQVYDNCKSGGLIKDDFQWGDLVVKNTLDPGRFNQYTFAGVYSFNDAT